MGACSSVTLHSELCLLRLVYFDIVSMPRKPTSHAWESLAGSVREAFSRMVTRMSSRMDARFFEGNVRTVRKSSRYSERTAPRDGGSDIQLTYLRLLRPERKEGVFCFALLRPARFFLQVCGFFFFRRRMKKKRRLHLSLSRPYPSARLFGPFPTPGYFWFAKAMAEFRSTAPESTVRAVNAAETGFGLSQDSLDEIILEKDINILARYGGVKGVTKKLRSDAENGLQDSVVRSQLRPPPPPHRVVAPEMLLFVCLSARCGASL